MNISTSIFKKNIAFIVFFCFFITSINSQENNVKEKSEFWQKVRFGGGIGLGINNNNFSATLAPSAIYQFNNSFALGVGISGTYLSISRKDALKATIFGGSLIGLYNPINEIQLSAELEQNNVTRNFDSPLIKDDNFWSPALFVGAGFRTRGIAIGLRYNVLHDDDKSIYAGAFVPFTRFYF